MARPTLKQMRDVLIERAFTVDVHYLDTDTFDRIEYNIKDVNSDIENNTSFYLDTVNKLKKLDKEHTELLFRKKGASNPLYLLAALSELRLEGRQRPQQRRFSYAVSSQQTCQLALSDGGADACRYGLHALLVAIADGEIFQTDRLHRWQSYE